MQKDEKELDLGLFFELADENKIIYSQVRGNTLMEDMKNLKYCLLMDGFFTLGDEKGTLTNSFFKDNIELA